MEVGDRMNSPLKSDPYASLRPDPPTPEEEICKCADEPPIVLQDAFSQVPIACLRCNLYVPPERIGFGEPLARGMAHWRSLHRALYVLWLDSEEYEEWASERLRDPLGRVQALGMEIVKELNPYRRAYYWWFEDNSVADFVPPSKCPRCEGELVDRFGRSVCEACSIMVHCND
jgi:hypothetical protein